MNAAKPTTRVVSTKARTTARLLSSMVSFVVVLVLMLANKAAAVAGTRVPRTRTRVPWAAKWQTRRPQPSRKSKPTLARTRSRVMAHCRLSRRCWARARALWSAARRCSQFEVGVGASGVELPVTVPTTASVSSAPLARCNQPLVTGDVLGRAKGRVEGLH